MHIVFTIANNERVPYFNWFAERAANDANHRFTFVALCKNRPGMIEDVGQYGWDCHWVAFDHHSRKKGMISAFFKLRKLLKKLKPDVVHSHLFDDAVPSLLAAKFADVKIRAIVKADTGFHYNYAPKWIAVDKFNNRNATAIVPPSEESKRFILEVEEAPLEKITMIHHGIPEKVFTAQKEEYKDELIKKYKLEGKKVIGTISRLIDWKGYKYIIEAAEQLVKEDESLHFLFVGLGDQKEELEQIVQQKNLSGHITFTGWMDRKYIPSLYGILDVYLHAANFEPFGFVIPEAMMNGAPVVSTPTGSALDAIEHKKNGFLAQYKDSQSLVEGVNFALENGAIIGPAGRVTALKMFTFDQMYDNYIKLYESNFKLNFE